MHETIYTIPLSESLDKESECPFCYLQNKLEDEQVSYALGPAMMEPDYRILSNEKGYCKRHTEKLANAKSALPYALIMDTRIDEVIKSLENFRIQKKRKWLGLKKQEKNSPAKSLFHMASSCLICDRINRVMSKFFDTFWYVYKKEADFRKRVLESKGFCLDHFEKLLQEAENQSGMKMASYVDELVELELKNLKRIKEDVHGFVLQFDYRNDKNSKTVPKNAHHNCGGKLSGYGKSDGEE